MNEEFQENLSINVTDTVAAGDAIGGSKPQKETNEDPIARQIEEEMQYLKRYVKPHNKPSRLVTEADIPKVLEEAKVMLKLCHIPRGYAGSAAAIAHTQIESDDPMRFFILQDGFLIVNPEIIKHTRHPVEKEEGCMSYPEELKKRVPRYNKVVVKFQAIIRGEFDKEKLYLSDFREDNLDGHIANIFQHECSHLNGSNIYDEDFTADSAVGIITREDVDKDEETPEPRGKKK